MNEEKKCATRTDELLVRYSLGLQTLQEVLKWAIDQLAQGKGSEHLRYIAGYQAEPGNFEPEELRKDFQNTLKELSLAVPTAEQARIKYAYQVCEKVVRGFISADDTLEKVYELWKDDCFSSLDTSLCKKKKEPAARFEIWMYLSISLTSISEGGPP